MATEEQKTERKALKQDLWQIRLHVEGDRATLTKRLKDLKAEYEALEGFTDWSGFPDKWEIGDPNGVKAHLMTTSDKAYTDVDRNNFTKLQDKSYKTIVQKQTPPGVNMGEQDTKGND